MKQLLNITDSPTLLFYSEKFFNFIIKYKKNILDVSETRDVDSDKMVFYKNDFYSYLLAINVPIEDHVIYLIINDYNTPYDFTEDVKTIIMPNKKYISELKVLFQSYKEN